MNTINSKHDVFDFQGGKFESDEDPDEKKIIKLMDILDEYYADRRDMDEDARQYAKDIIKLVREN